MRPPDKIPDFKSATFKPGDDCYLWTGKNYSEKTVVGLHDWKNALTVQDGIGKMQVGGHQVISAEQFKNEQREDRREKYADLIALWSSGIQDAKALGKSLSTTTSGAKSMIAAAKRWNLLTPDDPKPSNPDSSAGG